MKLNSSALDLNLPRSLQVPQSPNAGTFEFHLLHQTGVGQLQVLEKLQTVSQSQSVPAESKISKKLSLLFIITL